MQIITTKGDPWIGVEIFALFDKFQLFIFGLASVVQELS